MKHMTRFFSLALCAAMLLSLSAMAAKTPLISPAPETAPAGPLPRSLVWGKAVRQQNGSFLITSGDQDSINNQVVVHVPENTPCVDAVTGLPMDMTKFKDGDTLYTWVGPAMTMSLPPQTSAVVVVGNIPADYRVPEFYEITGVDQTVSIAIYPAPARTEVNLPVAGGETLKLPVSAQYTPWLTRQLVTVDDLVPGSQILVWRDKDSQVEKVLLFPYSYRGTLTKTVTSRGTIQVCVNGTFDGDKYPNAVQAACKKLSDGTALVPLRAVAEAVGCGVAWVSGQGAVVKDGDRVLFSILPGSETVQRSDEEGGEWTLSANCVKDAGVTYLPLQDLAHLLNLYYFNT